MKLKNGNCFLAKTSLRVQKLELKLTHGNIVQTKQLNSFGGRKESLLMTILVRSQLWLSGYIRNKKDVPMSATVSVQTLNFWKFESSFGNRFFFLIRKNQKQLNYQPNQRSSIQSHNDVALCAWLRLQHDLSSHPSFP